MENWSLNHDLVYVFVCVSYLADGEIDDSERKMQCVEILK